MVPFACVEANGTVIFLLNCEFVDLAQSARQNPDMNPRRHLSRLANSQPA